MNGPNGNIGFQGAGCVQNTDKMQAIGVQGKLFELQAVQNTNLLTFFVIQQKKNMLS